MVSSAAFVLVSPSYLMRSPPIVARTRFGFVFSGRSATTILRYVIVFPCGISLRWMKRIVSVPVFTVVPFPCANLPNSSDADAIHAGPSLHWLNSKYSAG